MIVLVACEESQIVCKAFLELGHNAYSCDMQKCSGGRPDRYSRSCNRSKFFPEVAAAMANQWSDLLSYGNE